ncbi:MAG: hypothetical protein HY075_16655 [Deltaproteobacteria bacterium]|nr:hypothetical protein [Deltaproteobacteria bacterium]
MRHQTALRAAFLSLALLFLGARAGHATSREVVVAQLKGIGKTFCVHVSTAPEAESAGIRADELQKFVIGELKKNGVQIRSEFRPPGIGVEVLVRAPAVKGGAMPFSVLLEVLELASPMARPTSGAISMTGWRKHGTGEFRKEIAPVKQSIRALIKSFAQEYDEANP